MGNISEMISQINLQNYKTIFENYVKFNIYYFTNLNGDVFFFLNISINNNYLPLIIP